MLKEKAGHSRNIDTLRNQDKVLKESFSLFKGGTLDFLDEDLSGVVTDILSSEITETTTKKAYGDNVFKLSSNKGIHLEWEARISEDDIKRFASYNIDFCRMHNLLFTTVIVTTQKPSITNFINPSMTFTPKIINLKKRDADKLLSEIEKKIQAGEHSNINELEIIYLPLYGSPSGKSTADLLNKVIKLAPKIARDDKHKQNKIQDLLILLTGSFVSVEELNKILEDNMRILEDSPAIRVLEDRGIIIGKDQGITEIAKNMLKEGDEYSKISRITGFDIDRIKALHDELQKI